MQFSNLKIQKYNKIIQQDNISIPQLSQLLTSVIVQSKGLFSNNKNIIKLNGNLNNQKCSIYIAPIQNQNVLDKIVFLKNGPKIIMIRNQPNIIFQEFTLMNLQQKIWKQQQKFAKSYLGQNQTKKIIKQICQSIVQYKQLNIPLNINTYSIVLRSDNKWEISPICALFNTSQYTSDLQSNQDVRILGKIMFKLLFGFQPIVQKSKYTYFNNYINLLKKQQNKKYLKIYNFTERCLQLSPQCIQFLQDSINGQMNFKQFLQNQYFYTKKQDKKIPQINKQVAMINSVQLSGYTLIMSAIDYKKKHPYQFLSNKQNFKQKTIIQISNQFQKDYVLKNINFIQNIQSRFSKVGNYHNQNQINIPYFYEKFQQNDYPCRDLIKWIDINSHKNSQNQLKLYAYPYTMVFQLIKVYNEQTGSIKRKIDKLNPLLLQLSNLYKINNVQPLHNTIPTINSYQDVKSIYRQNINQLYKHFLNEAIRKYNTKDEGINKLNKKQQGLQYYKLCLKLLQLSLLYRKRGQDLNLSRIQTSQRKDIQLDLSQLLQKYFPKNPIHY